MRDEGIEAIMIFTIVLQMFFVSTGRWIRELILPYIYMIPESAFKKLLYCLKQSVMVYAAEACVVGLGIGLIIKADILQIIMFIILRISFAILFMSANMLVERIAGALLIKWLTMIIYFLTLLILVMPGILLGTLMSSMISLSSGNAIFMFGMTLGNILIGLFTFYLCRNVLKYVELNN